MTGKRVEGEAALATAAQMLARLVESETHALVREAAIDGADRKAVVARGDALAKMGRSVASLLRTLEPPPARRAAEQEQEDEGMSDDDYARFDALPTEQKRAEIYRILDRMIGEESGRAGDDAGRIRSLRRRCDGLTQGA